jgi:hypothetical protein
VALLLVGIAASAALGGESARNAVLLQRARAELPVVDVRARTAVAGNGAQAALAKSLGIEGFVDVDPVTGTPSAVGRRDGFLTRPSRKDATTIALDTRACSSWTPTTSPASGSSATTPT